jgi:transcriptional regulator with GAF, ATPase, and Fis domain
VLINGESGVGKELVALGLHRRSSRADGPLVLVNCATIVSTMAEAELFGHEKGAFSGASRARPGHFQLADGGTLFLGEIGELSLGCQARLLRMLEDRSVHPVGANRPIQVDVRILAATNRDLGEEVREGRFRRDLYFRLEGMTIKVPPLRERLEDIPELVEYFLEKLRVDYHRPVGLSEAALERLQNFTWPGNVRQLRYVLEAAVAMNETGIIHAGDLHLE